MNFGAALTGLGQGFPQGLKDAQGITQQYEAGLDQQATAAAGQGLQLLHALSMQPPTPPQPQGMQPPPQQQPMGGGQSPMGGMQQPSQLQTMGGPPPMPQGPPSPQGGYGASGSPPMGAPPGGGMMGAPTPQPMQRGPMGQPGQQPPPMQPQQPQQGQSQQQGFGQQGGQQGGGLDWRTLIMAIQKGNPGAPPQVLMAAVNKLVPLMNSQSMLEWRQMQAQLGQQRVETTQRGQDISADVRARGQDVAAGGKLAQINTQRAAMGLPPLAEKDIGGGNAPGAMGQDPDAPKGEGQMGGMPPPTSTAEKIADDMAAYKRPPMIGGYGGLGAPVKMAPGIEKALAERHPDFNRGQAALKWQSEARLAQVMAGPQQVRFRQLEKSVEPFLGELEDLSRQMGLSGMTTWNEARLLEESRVRGNTPQGQLATKYITAFAGIRGELAQLENGGYAPTDASWKTAYEQVDKARGVQAQLAALSEIKKIIQFRVQGMDAVAPGLAPGGDNPYAPGAAKPKTEQPKDQFGDRFKGFTIAPVNQGQ